MDVGDLFENIFGGCSSGRQGTDLDEMCLGSIDATVTGRG